MKKRRFYIKTRIKILILLILVIYFGLAIAEQEVELNEQRQAIQDLNAQIADAKGESTELERMIEYTETIEFVERAAREYFGWVKEGEIKLVEKESENR